MKDYGITLQGFWDVAVGFSPALAGFILIAIYAHITHGEGQ